MVYYHTSGNVKQLRNIIIDYNATNEVTAHEYMKTYIEKCPHTTEDAKISWIVETFLGIQKHGQFLKEVSSHLGDELCEIDQDYFIIILHAVTFRITPKEKNLLYKCLFNLSKPLLRTITNFLSNNEVLAFLSQIAQPFYDTKYITDEIINPLFTWQPYISEMAHNYAEHVFKIESRKLKPSTIPKQLTVMTRTGKKGIKTSPTLLLPAAPPNSEQTKKKMLTKNVIDEKLKICHEKNKLRASNLLNHVKTKNYHYAQQKLKKVLDGQDEINNFVTSLHKPKPQKSSAFLVKDTIGNIKRTNRRIQIAQDEEVEWLQTLLSTCGNTSKVDEFEEYVRQEKERDRLLDIERKHLIGQISYEEAVIAKKKLLEINKKKHETFVKEKEHWNQEIEKWRKLELEKNRKQVEKLSMIELNLLQAKNELKYKNKEIAEKLKKDSEMLLAKAMKEKQEELDRRINMIKEIKILATIGKNARLPKIIDLTETSGTGLLCEMSLAELQERLAALKIGLKEELEKKKNLIKEENLASKQELQETKNTIDNFMNERASLRKQNQKKKVVLDTSTSKEISYLKNILEEKRQLRRQLAG